MKKLGFTLAEMLLCIGVLGVIAAMTLPSLNSNVQKQQVGPGLAKAMNSIKAINDFALQQYNARTLEEILATDGKDSNQYFNHIMGKYMQYDVIYKSDNPWSYKKFNGTNFELLTNHTHCYQTKDGIAFFRPSPMTPQSIGDETSHLGKGYSGKYYIVYVDINGINKFPNTLGKDVFQLLVDTKGVVIPYGGAAHKNYTNDTKILWHGDNSDGCTKKGVKNAESCAGSVVDNAYKVIYDWN